MNSQSFSGDNGAFSQHHLRRMDDFILKYSLRQIVRVKHDYTKEKDDELSVKEGETVEMFIEGKVKKEYYERGWLVKRKQGYKFLEACTIEGKRGFIGHDNYSEKGNYEREHYVNMLRHYAKKNDRKELLGRVLVTMHVNRYLIVEFFIALVHILGETNVALTTTGVYVLYNAAKNFEEIRHVFAEHAETIIEALATKITNPKYPSPVLKEIFTNIADLGAKCMTVTSDGNTVENAKRWLAIIEGIDKKLAERQREEEPWKAFWSAAIASDRLSDPNWDSLLRRLNGLNFEHCIGVYLYVALEAFKENQIGVLRMTFAAFTGIAERSMEFRRKLTKEIKEDMYEELKETLKEENCISYANAAAKMSDFLRLDWRQFHRKYIEHKAVTITVPPPQQNRTPIQSPTKNGNFSPKLASYSFESLETQKKLGEGGQATALLVKTKTLPDLVVAKIFIDLKKEIVDFESCLKELESLTKFGSHPNIVRIYGAIEMRSVPTGILMEYCKDGTLDDAIRDSAFTYNTNWIIRWFTHASSALLFLHNNKVLHRDIKPSNMLLCDGRKNLKVSDFGLTKNAENKTNDDGQSSKLYFKYLMGTVGYAAPELWEQQPYNERVDIYSLGVTIWETVNRKRATKHQWMQPANGSKHQWMNDLMQKMIQKKPNLRPNMQEVYGTLKKLYDQLEQAENAS